ncbi:uncharacterized protein RCC_07556 [Ramularia collo-cygni]|uniref:Uncharacterized protein n=1 Tax=Ramularia collo-cygni TaxID=112498 RepID=A0A2D3UXU6_9PEZI|nr:uncharacterized protein RCC_07556 [Ramularia collo-cygni]CZT21691.1 uncharacterized protein RCC_07556 [Ramularia collo-cygni]
MYFVQFERPPRVLTEEAPFMRTWITGAITIATQPNGTIYDQDITLKASLLSSNDDDTPCLTESYEWRAGMTRLPIVFDVSNGVIWPVRVLVCADGQESGSLSPLATPSLNRTPRVCLAWSPAFDNLNPIASDERVERRFKLSSKRTLRAWESCGQNSAQIKSSGVVLLSHLDDVIGLRTDGVKQMEQKFALAASKKLSIIDMSQNCGAIGITVAQLIPDSNVVILDDAEALPTIEDNIRMMSPAFASTVRFGDWNSSSMGDRGSPGRPVDMIFSTAAQFNDDKSLRTVEILGKMIERSPKAVVVLVEEEIVGNAKTSHGVGRSSPLATMLRERGHKLRGSETFPGDPALPQYHVMVFHGSNRR